MPRIRYLKPDFFKDEDLAELPYWVRLLYAGLWVIADKEGKLEDRPKRIKAEVFPYDRIDVEKGLQLLSKNKKYGKNPFIIRYSIDGQSFIKILNWEKHQKPHHTEKAKNLPDPPKEILERLRHGYNTVITQEGMENGERRMENGKGNGEYIYNGSDKSKNDSPEPSTKLSPKEKYFQSVKEFFDKPDQEWLQTLKETYPSLDVEAELKKMKAWLLSNYPSRQKKNFKRFAINWLNKEVDKPRKGRGPKGGYDMETYKKLKEAGINVA